MRFYRVKAIIFNGNDEVLWAATFKDAKDTVKIVRNRADDIEVDLVEVATNTKGILKLLTFDPSGENWPIVRTWTVTPRGGLKEVKP